MDNRTLVSLYAGLAMTFADHAPCTMARTAEHHLSNANEHVDCLDSPAFDPEATRCAIRNVLRDLTNLVGG